MADPGDLHAGGQFSSCGVEATGTGADEARSGTVQGAGAVPSVIAAIQPLNRWCTVARRRSARRGARSPPGNSRNGRVWLPPMPAVEPDQFLERRTLVRVGIVEAVDEDVGGVRERVRASKVVGGVRSEVGQRIHALDSVVGRDTGSHHRR